MSAETKERHLFGTDGIRGRYGTGWLAPDPVSALGRAVGNVLGHAGTSRALVGHDGRRSGPTLEDAIGRGLSAAGFEVQSAGLITTPGLALLARTQPFDLGVMISASHNPASDNGIKIFGAQGEKLADEVELAIEAELERDASPVTEGNRPPHVAELEEAYLAHLAAACDGLDLTGKVIVLDCANGGGSRVAPRILGRLGARVVGIACAPDGENINEGCGSTHPEGLREAVRLHSADLGIALDGDGDRCILVDEHAQLVDGDGILTILARHMKNTGRLPGSRIVATVMSNKGLHRALGDADIEVVTVGVGDRRVVEALRREELALGGEQSGHIVFGPENHFIGDGTYTALRVLQAMTESSRSLSELAAPFQAYPQVLLNVPVASKPAFAEVPGVEDAVAAAEDALAGDGRVLLRYSGTENLARVMVEGADQDEIRTLAGAIAKCIAAGIGSAE